MAKKSNSVAPKNAHFQQPYSIFPRFLLVAVGVMVLAIGISIFFPQNPILSYLYERFAHKIPELHFPLDFHYFWGTYSPNYYISMRHANASSLQFGIFWFKNIIDSKHGFKIHTVCTEDNKVDSFNWLYHDAKSFGVQQIIDKDFVLNVTFLKAQNSIDRSWTMHMTASSRTNKSTSITFVPFIFGPKGVDLKYRIHTNKVYGSTNQLGDFTFMTNTLNSKAKINSKLELGLKDNNLVATGLSYSFYYDQSENRVKMLESVNDRGFSDGVLGSSKNLIFYQLQFQLDGISSSNRIPQSFPGGLRRIGKIGPEIPIAEFSFKNLEKGNPPTGQTFIDSLRRKMNHFTTLFVSKFGINSKSFTENQIFYARCALGNLLGGLGYFHGQSLVRYPSTGDHKTIHMYEPRSLLTATPSRHQFPRGFLWDEGFHQLVIARWDVRLSLTIITHWLNLMDTKSGWIPREQILGFEARTIVPSEFVVQSDLIANPPALILSIDYILDQVLDPNSDMDSDLRNEAMEWFHNALPRIDLWYKWYNRTQHGHLPGSYLWVGREVKEQHLNPLTLSSGLDDFPRSSHPAPSDRHLDLYCWMTYFTKFLARLTGVLAPKSTMHDEYSKWASFLSEESHLEKMHWSPRLNLFADYGLHTDAIHLVQVHLGDRVEMRRQVELNPSQGFVNSAHGVMNYFPLALKVLSPKSAKLPILIESLHSKESGIWTPHGLRSLSNSSIFYQKKNSEHDPPYWRGAIWINVNYLIFEGLKYYAKHPDTPEQIANTALDLAKQLQKNLVATVIGQFEDTGFLWEQYNDLTGRGQRAHPFAGWTTLITLIMQDI